MNTRKEDRELSSYTNKSTYLIRFVALIYLTEISGALIYLTEYVIICNIWARVSVSRRPW